MADGVNYVRGRIDVSLAGPADLVSIAPAAGGVSRRTLHYVVHIEVRSLFSAICLPK